MRNVPWQGEIPPGAEQLFPDDFVAKTQYNSDMAVVNSKIFNVGSVAQWASDKCRELVAELAVTVGKVEELEADDSDYSEKIAAMLSTLSNHAEAIVQLNSSLSDIDRELDITDDTVEQNTESINVLSSSIAILRENVNTELAAVKADILNVKGRMDSVEVSVSTLRAQHETDKVQLQNSINSLSTALTALGTQFALYKDEADKALNEIQLSVIAANDNVNVVRETVNGLQADYKSFKNYTDDEISEINKKINEIMGYEPVDIVKFTATPNICEIGGSENIILNWETSGSVEGVSVNNVPVEGTTVTMPAVTDDTEYRLKVFPTIGSPVSKVIYIKFVNHIFWGTTKSDVMSKSVVKGLANTEMTDEIVRDITLNLDNDYVVYAYPKRLGTVTFEVTFKGGFEAPAVIAVDNHSEYSEDYYVYRSTRKLTGDIAIHIDIV